MKHLKKAFVTIRARILLVILVFILILSAIITSISYFFVSSNLRRSLIQTSETRLSFLCSSIDSNVGSVRSFIRSCQKSSKIKNFAMEEETGDNKKKREAHDYMIEVYTSNTLLPSQLIRVVVIGKFRKDIIQVVESAYASLTVSSDAILSLPLFNELHANPGKLSAGILQDPFIHTKPVQMIPFVNTIEHPYEYGEIGYIYTEMSPSVITDPIHNYLTETDSSLFFRIGDEQYQYADQELTPFFTDYKLEKDLSELALEPTTVIQKVRFEGSNTSSILVSRPLATEDWYVTECLDMTMLSENIFQIFPGIVLLILAASALICVVLSWFLSRTVNQPVKQLQARMKRIEDGDFSRDPSTEWDHELGDVGKTINDLSENVLSLMNQKLEDERQKKDFEYKMLQSQINPHFIYNTLNSIKWMATIQNAPGIAEMTTALSRLLKDISKGTENLVTLKHEISLLNDYFTIQQYRYGGTITLKYEIQSDSLTSCQILRFTLQPIVENAIFHGIEPKETAGEIQIHIYRESEEDVRIDVTDNGVGMEPEVVEHLLDQDAPGKSAFFKEIGIANVHKRLQYEFGGRYGLTITSKPGEFTNVSILLPYDWSQDPEKS